MSRAAGWSNVSQIKLIKAKPKISLSPSLAFTGAQKCNFIDCFIGSVTLREKYAKDV
jgi:hypothetical protein